MPCLCYQIKRLLVFRLLCGIMWFQSTTDENYHQDLLQDERHDLKGVENDILRYKLRYKFDL